MLGKKRSYERWTVPWRERLLRQKPTGAGEWATEKKISAASKRPIDNRPQVDILPHKKIVAAVEESDDSSTKVAQNQYPVEDFWKV